MRSSLDRKSNAFRIAKAAVEVLTDEALCHRLRMFAVGDKGLSLYYGAALLEETARRIETRGLRLRPPRVGKNHLPLKTESKPVVKKYKAPAKSRTAAAKKGNA